MSYVLFEFFMLEEKLAQYFFIYITISIHQILHITRVTMWYHTIYYSMMILYIILYDLI